MSKKKSSFKLRVTYNAPVTLSFALISAVILLVDTFSGKHIISLLFTAPGNAKCIADSFNITDPLDYVKLIFHIFGHADWNHFLSNMAFILLLGPVVEDKYGSPLLVLMMTITSLVTGVLNACFSPVQMLGSSDIAFMMILLASFTSISKNEIPLSFILILVLYIGREILGTNSMQNISTLAHIAGGICGSMFAFLVKPRPRVQKQENADSVPEDFPKKEKKSRKSSSPTVSADQTIVQTAPENENTEEVFGSIDL